MRNFFRLGGGGEGPKQMKRQIATPPAGAAATKGSLRVRRCPVPFFREKNTRTQVMQGFSPRYWGNAEMPTIQLNYYTTEAN